MEKRKILAVDDEQGIRNIIKEYITSEEYEVVEAADGVEALNLLKQGNISMVILDVMLPKMDGWTVCRELRRTSDIPVIMLSARGEEYDKLFGFELGVDDYLVKPFSPRELLARIKAIFARSDMKVQPAPAVNRIQIEEFSIDFDSRNVTLHGKQISLTPKEYELLSFLIKNQNKVFSRSQLLDLVWGYEFFGDDRTVDTHIKMLRESLKEYRHWIVTVWGTGYKFEIGGKDEADRD